MKNNPVFFFIVGVGCLFAFLTFMTPAHAKDGQIKIEFFPENDSPAVNPVTLILQGTKYPTNGWFDQMVAAGTHEPDERFIIDAIAALKHGSWQDVRNTWMSEEQDEQAKYLTNPDMFAKSQSWAKAITASAFLGKIVYGNYEIFIVQHEVRGHGTRFDVYPIRNINGRFYLTNRLHADPVFLYVSSMYAKALTFKKR